MDLDVQLKPYLDGRVRIKQSLFVLESVERDHLVLRDEDSMHTVIWYSSIQSVNEAPLTIPEIILSPKPNIEQD